MFSVTSFITRDHTSDTENYNIVQSIHIHDPVSLEGCTTLLINTLLTVPNKSLLVIKVKYMCVTDLAASADISRRNHRADDN